MKDILASAALLAVLVSFSSLNATEKQYETGRIVSVEKKSRERILYYLVNTPVTREDPYYQLSLELNHWQYEAEYIPRHAADSLPEDWKAGTEVQMKLWDKRHMLVKRPEGLELQLIILKRLPGDPGTAAPQPSTRN
jgi:hypothetical protein